LALTIEQDEWSAEDVQARRVVQAVKRAQLGDRDALGFLYARFADDVHRCVLGIVSDCHEAEDVTQQVFAKLIRVIGLYEQRDVSFLAWVLRVAKNLAIDHLRQQRTIPVEHLEIVDEHDHKLIGDGGAVALQDALSTLPADQREVVLLRHFAGLSPAEIALRTGRTEGSIHGLHHRGRRALKRELTSRGAAPSTRRRSPVAGGTLA
jgi:RNA polymerase sigma-70 factor, ECF subfamily